MARCSTIRIVLCCISMIIVSATAAIDDSDETGLVISSGQEKSKEVLQSSLSKWLITVC